MERYRRRLGVIFEFRFHDVTSQGSEDMAEGRYTPARGAKDQAPRRRPTTDGGAMEGRSGRWMGKCPATPQCPMAERGR